MKATVALQGECSGMRVPRDQRHKKAAHLIAGVPHRLPAMCRRGSVHLKQSKLGRMLAARCWWCVRNGGCRDDVGWRQDGRCKTRRQTGLDCPVRFQHAALSHCLLYCGSPLLSLLRSVVHFPFRSPSRLHSRQCDRAWYGLPSHVWGECMYGTGRKTPSATARGAITSVS